MWQYDHTVNLKWYDGILFCKRLGESWRLPKVEELKLFKGLHDEFTGNFRSDGFGFDGLPAETKFGFDGYWTGRGDFNSATAYSFRHNIFLDHSSDIPNRIRPVREI